MPAYFVTGTDTSVGKTLVTRALMRACKKRHFEVVAMKPIATGARPSVGGMRNEDADLLGREASVDLPYADINPYPFAPPVAPHIAAQAANTTIDINRIEQSFDRCRRAADMVFVEGIGGWMIPLGQERWLSDIVERLALPVILVVGLRIGCINHALLTVRAIARDGAHLAGWVATPLTPHYESLAATIDTLRAHIDAPLLCHLPWSEPVDVELLAVLLVGAVDQLTSAQEGTRRT